MVNENKSKLFAAAAGIIVGAGAAIAGAVALSDKKNQKKVREVIAKGQAMARNYAADVNERAKDTKEAVEETVETGKAKAKKLVKVAKNAQKGVKSI